MTAKVPHCITVHRRSQLGKDHANVCQMCGKVDMMPDGIDPCHMCEGCFGRFKAWHQGPNLAPGYEPYHVTLTRFSYACPTTWVGRPKDATPPAFAKREKAYQAASLKNDGSLALLMGRG